MEAWVEQKHLLRHRSCQIGRLVAVGMKARCPLCHGDIDLTLPRSEHRCSGLEEDGTDRMIVIVKPDGKSIIFATRQNSAIALRQGLEAMYGITAAIVCPR